MTKPAIKPLTCVLLVRPMDTDDPCLTRTPEGLALDGVLRSLRQAGLVDRAVLSLPQGVPASVRSALDFIQAEIETDEHEAPQKRLAGFMAREDLDRVLVLTAYSLLLDEKAVRNAARAVAQGKADAAWPEGVIPPKFFMVLNRQAADRLAQDHPHPLPPFVFPDKLNHGGPGRLLPLTGLEKPRERFLWELLFAGERNAVPPGVYAEFLARHADNCLENTAFEAFISERYGLDPEAAHGLDQALAETTEFDSSLRLAMQLNYARDLCEHLPPVRDLALEIGHGVTGLTSLALALAFGRVLGADPQKHNPQGLATARRLLKALCAAGMRPVPEEQARFDAGSLEERTHFHEGPAHSLPLEPESLDFCFSRVVFEHVSDVPGTSRFLARAMKPGGVMLHEIGLQDHDDLSHIHFEFLRHSPEEWAALNKSTNLWRVNDFVDLWEELGFTVEVLKRDVRPVPPERLHPHWRDYREEDLYCYQALIKAVKQDRRQP